MRMQLALQIAAKSSLIQSKLRQLGLLIEGFRAKFASTTGLHRLILTGASSYPQPGSQREIALRALYSILLAARII